MERKTVSLATRLLALGLLALGFSFASHAAARAANTLCPLMPTQGHGKHSTLLSDCTGDGGGGTGGTTTPPPPPTVMMIGSQCNLPGAHADDRCTVDYHVYNNPANYIVCLWSGNSLIDCEGRTLWGGGLDWVTAAGVDVEFRHHTVWPTQDPDWPNASVVRNKGVLLKSQHIVARSRVAPAGACGVTVQVGASIQAAINTGAPVVCLATGTHSVGSQLVPRAGQTIRSADTSHPATIVPAAGITTILVNVAGVTIRDLVIDGVATARPQYGVLVYGGSNTLMERLTINRALIGLGISASAANVEFRDSAVNYAGDGQACPGCAQPSVWINASSDVRLVQSTFLNNGIGPEGDGEIGCYNSPNVVIQNSTVQAPGASGIYLVNCDHAVVIGNLVHGAKEWGLDIVDTNQASGSDFGLFQWNTVEYSRNGGAVLKNSIYDVFTNNTWTNNLQGGSGTCNGVNLRNTTTGFYSLNDTASPWPVYCSDN